MTRQQVQVVLMTLLVVLSLGAAVAFVPGTAAAVDQELVDDINDGVQETNDRMEADLHPELENTDPPDMMEPVDPDDSAEEMYNHLDSEVDRLSIEMLHAVVGEINAVAEEMGQGQIIDPDDIETPDDARAEGDGFVDDYGHITDRADEGQDGLYEVADSVEELNDRFGDALNQLETEAFSDADMGTIEGTVTDEDGDPIEGVEIEAEEGPGEATTDENGEYEIEILSGDNTLVFSHADLATTEEEVSVGTDETETVDVTMAEDGDEEDDGGLLATVLNVGGLLLTVVAIGGAIGVGAFGSMRDAEDGPSLKTVGASLGLMAITGVAVGAAGYLSLGWALSIFTDSPLLEDFGPLIALMVVFMVAPALSVLLALADDAGSADLVDLAQGTLVAMGGAVLLVLLALAIISAAASDGAVETIDGVAIAGVVGLLSAIGYTVTGIFSGQPDDAEPTPAVATADD